MRSRAVRLTRFLLVAAIVGSYSTAFAQDDSRQAAELADSAIEAFSAGDVEQAVSLYEQAFALVPDPSFAFNLASLYQSVGDLPNAERYFAAYIELFPGASDRAEVEATLTQLRADLQQNYAQLIVETNPDGASVILRGDTERKLGVTPLSTWLAPGSVLLSLRIDGYEEISLSYNAVAGVRIPVNETMWGLPIEEPVWEPVEEPVVTPIEEPVEEPVEEPLVVEPGRDSGSSDVAGYALLGTGVAFIGGGIGLYFAGVGAANDHNDLVEGISPGVPGDADEIDNLASKARTFSTGGVIGAGVGAALAGVGTWLIVRDSPTQVSFAPTGRGGFAVTLSGHF